MMMVNNGSSTSTTTATTTATPTSNTKSFTTVTMTESPLTPSPIMNNAVVYEHKRPLRAISKPYFPHLQPREEPQQTVNINPGPIRNPAALASTSMLQSVPNVATPSASMIPSMPNLAS